MKTRTVRLVLQACLLCTLLLTATTVRAQSQPSVPITITTVVAEDVAPSVPAAGTVFSRNEIQITSGLAARIAWIAEPGDYIEAGGVVVRFDCNMLSLRREELLATAERERVNVATFGREAVRLEKAHQAMVASETDLMLMRGQRDRAASELKIVEVRIRQVDTEIERCIARSPFAGVVTEQMRSVGEDVERSTVLVAMTDTRNLEVRASVPIRYLPRIRTGAVAAIRLDELRIDGRIRKAVPAGDVASQTFEVRIELPTSAAEVVAAGQLVSVSLPLAATHTLTVPRDSIVLRDDGAFVMRINNENRAERVAIQVSDANGTRVGVRGALQAGDRVAVRGAEALDEGDTVSVRTET